MMKIKKSNIAILLAVTMISWGQGVYATRFGAVDKYEAEALKYQENKKIEVADDRGFSEGKGLLLKADEAGDKIYFSAVNIKQKGVYNIKIGVKKGPDCGIIQLIFPDINVKVGTEQDLYAPEYQMSEVDLGNQICNISDARQFEIRVTGKNDASTGFYTYIDYLYLTYFQNEEITGGQIPLFADENMTAGAGDIPYEWGQVAEGGTGCSTHIVFHPSQQDLVYMGTDMGGLYRWQPETKSWKPITDIFDSSHFHYYGIDSVALAETDPNLIYIACGENTNKGLIGEVLKSNDQGETWTFTGFKQFFAANQDQRYFGECMAVDPVNADHVIVATIKEGLYRTNDGFATWEKMNDPIPVTGTEYPRIVVYDRNSAADGITKRIYCGVYGKGIYMSEDAGDSWVYLEGSPSHPSKIKISDDGTMVVGTVEEGLFKYKNHEWNDISPNTQTKNWQQVTIDKHNSDYMITAWHWGPEGQFGEYVYYSTNGGTSWTLINDKCIRNHTVPRIEWGGFFANVSDIAIDPFDSGRVFMVGWQNFYETDDIFAERSAWTNYLKGVEHGCTLELLSGISGANLIVSAYDYGGGRFTDVTQYCDEMLPPKQNPPRSAVMAGNPNVIVRIGKNKSCYSTDNGISWRYFGTQPSVNKDAVNSAVSAQNNPETGLPVFTAVFAGEAPYVSFDMGDTWTQSSGAAPSTSFGKWDTATYLAADGEDPEIVYYVSGNDLYRSNDYGRTYKRITSFSSFSSIKTMPGIKGAVWVRSGDELLVSSSYGEMFRKIDAVTKAGAFGFGKAAEGEMYPAVYVSGTINGKEGIHRSTDYGNVWITIYDFNKAKNKWQTADLVGDMQNFGVVYIGSIGRGIHYGAPNGENPFLKLRGDEVKVVLNNQPIAFDAPPFVSDGRTLVPMRKIFEAAGAQVSWDENTNKITAVRKVSDNYAIGETTVELTVGSSRIVVNGEEQEMDTVPVIKDGRTFVPVRFVTQALGAKVDWMDDEKIVNIRI